MLSSAFNPEKIVINGIPQYDLIVIEEASQVFLTAIVAFKSLGRLCLIVGDPMQLPPIVKLNNPFIIHGMFILRLKVLKQSH